MTLFDQLCAFLGRLCVLLGQLCVFNSARVAYYSVGCVSITCSVVHTSSVGQLCYLVMCVHHSVSCVHNSRSVVRISRSVDSILLGQLSTLFRSIKCITW